MQRWLVQKMIRFCIQTYTNEITNFLWMFALFSYTDDQHQQTILKLRAFCCRNLNVSQFWDFIWRSLYRWGLLSSFSYLYTKRRVYFVRWTKKNAWTHHMTVSHPHYYNHHWFLHYSTCPLKFIHIHNYEANLE